MLSAATSAAEFSTKFVPSISNSPDLPVIGFGTYYRDTEERSMSLWLPRHLYLEPILIHVLVLIVLVILIVLIS